MELQYSETTLQIHEEWQRQKWNPITTLGLISFPWSNTLVSVTGGQVYSLLITHVGMQRCIWNLQLPVNSTFKNLNVEFTSLNVEFTSSCRFQIHLCIPTCIISSEYTWPSVTETSVFDQGNKMRIINSLNSLMWSWGLCLVVHCNSRLKLAKPIHTC